MKRKIYLSILVLVGLVAATYFNAIHNEFVSDDVTVIVRDKTIGDISAITSKPFVFVQSVFYYIVFHISGLNPAGFHILNISFHAGVVLLVYSIFFLMQGPLFAFVGAALFAVHPLLTESVTWISGGSYLIYSFFFLGSFLTYLLAKKNRKWYVVSLILFLLSLFSSGKATALCLVFPMYEVAEGKLRLGWKKFLPFFVFASGFIIFYLSGIGERITSLTENYYQVRNFHNPLLQIPVAITSYLKLFFWPDELSFYHSELMFTPPQFIARVIFFLLFVAALFFAYKKQRQIFFWLCFFIITLLPTLTPVAVAWVVAERYVYLGTVGLVFPVAFLFLQLWKYKKYRTAEIFIFIFIVLAFMLRTVVRNLDWKNSDTLWLATEKTAPSDPKSHNNLGLSYRNQGKYQLAEDEFKTAIKLNPRYADAYHNLANVYHLMGRDNDALQNYYNALTLNPNLWQSYQQMGLIYYQAREYAESERWIKKALVHHPTQPNLYVSLGVIYLDTNRKSEAKKAFEQAVNLDPNNGPARQGVVEASK